MGNTDWNDTINQNSTKAATEAQLYKATQLNVKYSNNDKSSVILDGTTYEKGKDATGTRLTNVAYANVNGTDTGSDAVNVDLLKDYVAENAGSTNVKAGTNIEVKDGVVSLKSDVTLDADANDNNKDGKKIALSGTNGTINAVNTTKSEPKYGWDGIKTTTTTNTFDFSDGGKFVTEKNENTVVKNLKGKITSERDLVTTNTTEFNEKGATFSKVETDKGWKKKFLFGKDTWDTTTNSSTNIDGGTITLSSNTRGENKVVIDGTTGEMTGLSNTTWDARKAADGSYESSTKAATEAQLQGVYNTAEDAYDTAEDAKNEAGKHTTVKLSDKNLTLKKGTNEVGGAEYTLGLNSVVTLNGDKPDGDGIVLNGESGSIHAVNTQAIGDGFFGNKIDLNKFDFDNDGAKFVTVKTKFGTAVKDGIEVHTTEFNENGATFTKTSITEDNMKLNNSSTNIDGGVVTTDKVQGLDNTKWDDGLANAVDKSKRLQGMAATQGQLRDVDVKVNENTQAIEKNTTDIGALQGQVDQGWTVSDGKSETADFNVKPGYTLKFNGDKNIDVTADDGAVNVGLKPVVTLGGDTEDSNKVVLDGENGTISVTNEYTTRGPAQTITNKFNFNKEGATFTNTTKHGNGNGYGNAITSSTNIDGGTITISSDARKDGKDIVIDGTTGEMSGLSNTDWDPQKASSYETSDKAATEAQLQKATGAISKDLNTLNNFAVKYDKNTDGTVNKNSITLAGGESGTQIHNVKAGEADTDAVNVSQLNSKTGNLDYSSNKYVTDKDNLTTAVGKLDDAIQKTSATANKGWTANAGNKDIDVKPGDTLQFKGDDNITVSATTDRYGKNDAINVKLNPVVTLDNNHNDNEVVLNGYAGTISAKNSKEFSIWGNGSKTTNTFDFDNGGKFETTKSDIIFGVPVNSVTHTAEFNEDGATFTKEKGRWQSSTNIDGGVVTTDIVKGLNNTKWDDKLADAVDKDERLQGIAATQGQLQTVDSKVNAGWIATDGTNKVNINPNNNTLKFAGDDNITVTATTDKDGNNAINVKLDDDITLGNGENAININGTDGTLKIGSKFTVDKDGNVSSAGNISSNGDVIADADGEEYSLSEVGKYAVRYDKTNDGTSTITLADGDDLSGTRIKNVADGVDPKDAVNVSQLKAVEATASAGWTAIAGDNDAEIKVTPGSILNFEDDGNITVSGTKESNELKFGLNHNITLDNVEKARTKMVFNTDGREGYIPDNYKEDSGQINDFIKEHGGFALYYANPDPNSLTHEMTGTFGVTTDGMVHAKDVIVYTTSSDPAIKDTVNYSLKEVGDMVSQMATYYKDGKAYTVFSHFTNDADKENPFEVVDENGNLIENASRDISLAVRDDGAVLIGATVKGDSFTESGIRINENDSQMITGLSNTTWTPTVNKRIRDGETPADAAATVGQLNALYGTVVGYNTYMEDGFVKVDNTHVTLGGTDPNTAYSSKEVNGVKTYSGGVKFDNVAYAVTDTTSQKYDGSAAVNVDLLKDTIAGVKAETNTDVGDLNFSKVEGTVIEDGKDNVTTAIGKLDNKVGDLNYSKAQGTEIEDGKDDLTTAIGKLDNKIDSIGGTATNADNDTITGGKIDAEKGTISLTQKDKGTITLEGQFTNSVVDSAELKDGTLTITSKDQYSGDTSSVKVEGIASTEVVGAKNKEDLATAYKDADKDGNATTEYITDSESMVEADVALDHAIQDVAGTSYANDMVLSNRIDSVEKRLGDVEQRIDKVGAMAAAIANLRTMGFDPEAPTEIAVGVGQYKSETGLAIGVFHYPNQDFMLSASLSTSGDEVMGGIGATWRIGRKTAAEKAKDEEKRILAKAEEIKQAAKRAEVKAQADRHAKLLAEREAKGESIRPIENKVEQTQEQA